MGRRSKQLTQEQIDFRNSILRGKLRSIKKADPAVVISNLSIDDQIRKCFYYLNNCVFWINEYIDGKEPLNKLLTTSKAIQEHGRKLEQLIKEL